MTEAPGGLDSGLTSWFKSCEAVRGWEVCIDLRQSSVSLCLDGELPSIVASSVARDPDVRLADSVGSPRGRRSMAQQLQAIPRGLSIRYGLTAPGSGSVPGPTPAEAFSGLSQSSHVKVPLQGPMSALLLPGASQERPQTLSLKAPKPDVRLRHGVPAGRPG